MLQNYISKAALVTCFLVLAACSQTGLQKTAGGADTHAPVPAQREYQAALKHMQAEENGIAADKLAAFVTKYPEYPGGYINLAIVYDRQGRTDEAIALLNRAIEIEPQSVTALNQLAVIQRQQGQLLEAEKLWLQTTEIDPGYTYAWYNLGVLYDLYKQDLPAALDHYRRYQELTGSTGEDPVVALWITDLERRVGTPARAAQARENQ